MIDLQEMHATLTKLKHFIDFSIENQEELKAEHSDTPFPEWNKGYLECLETIKRIIND